MNANYTHYVSNLYLNNFSYVDTKICENCSDCIKSNSHFKIAHRYADTVYNHEFAVRKFPMYAYIVYEFYDALTAVSKNKFVNHSELRLDYRFKRSDLSNTSYDRIILERLN